MALNSLIHALFRFLTRASGRDTAGEIGGVRRIVGASVFNDDEKSVGLHFFKPACRIAGGSRSDRQRCKKYLFRMALWYCLLGAPDIASPRI